MRIRDTATVVVNKALHEVQAQRFTAVAAEVIVRSDTTTMIWRTAGGMQCVRHTDRFSSSKLSSGVTTLFIRPWFFAHCDCVPGIAVREERLDSGSEFIILHLQAAERRSDPQPRCPAVTKCVGPSSGTHGVL